MEGFYELLWFLFGYDNSLFDNRIMQHIAGGYVISHISSLFLKRKYWLICLFAAIVKESLDHFLFGCGGNEIKHFVDVGSWFFGGLSYYLIVLLKERKK